MASAKGLSFTSVAAKPSSSSSSSMPASSSSSLFSSSSSPGIASTAACVYFEINDPSDEERDSQKFRRSSPRLKSFSPARFDARSVGRRVEERHLFDAFRHRAEERLRHQEDQNASSSSSSTEPEKEVCFRGREHCVLRTVEGERKSEGEEAERESLTKAHPTRPSLPSTILLSRSIAFLITTRSGTVQSRTQFSALDRWQSRAFPRSASCMICVQLLSI